MKLSKKVLKLTKRFGIIKKFEFFRLPKTKKMSGDGYSTVGAIPRHRSALIFSHVTRDRSAMIADHVTLGRCSRRLGHVIGDAYPDARHTTHIIR